MWQSKPCVCYQRMPGSMQRVEPGLEILKQWARVMQRFVVSDYDFANGDKISDTLYKSIEQRCMLEDLDFDVLVSGMKNDDIPATRLEMDAEVEELVELAMQAREAEIAAGVYPERVAKARTVWERAQGLRAEEAAVREAQKGRRKGWRKKAEEDGALGLAAAGTGRGRNARRARRVGAAKDVHAAWEGGAPQGRGPPRQLVPPVIDELKLLQMWLDKGASGFWACVLFSVAAALP